MTSAAGGPAAAPPSQDLIKSVRKEWKRLRTGLPKGIFVRASEERMDLVATTRGLGVLLRLLRLLLLRRRRRLRRWRVAVDEIAAVDSRF